MAVEFNADIPCYGYDKEKLVLNPWQDTRALFEIDRSIRQCPVFNWRTEVEDVRHSKLDINVTYGDLQKDNGVYEALASLIPNKSESAKESILKWSKRD